MSDRYDEIIKHYSFTRLHQLPSAFIMSKSKFDKLSPADQKLVQQTANEAVKEGIAAHDRMTSAAIEKMQSRGIVIEHPDAAELKAISRKAWPRILADVPDGQALVAEIEAAKKK